MIAFSKQNTTSNITNLDILPWKNSRNEIKEIMTSAKNLPEIQASEKCPTFVKIRMKSGRGWGWEKAGEE